MPSDGRGDRMFSTLFSSGDFSSSSLSGAAIPESTGPGVPVLADDDGVFVPVPAVEVESDGFGNGSMLATLVCTNLDCSISSTCFG